MSGPRKTLLISAGLFFFNVAVNAPLFLPGEHKYRDSIEGGYASMARFISEHPNPFGWNPLQYRGLPTHDWYLPVVPYTGAFAIRLAPFLKPEHVYRLLVVTITCLGPVTMFWFMLEFTRSRRWSLFAALAYMLFSASYVLFPAIKADQGITYVPWRIQVLVKYGEGPHNVGLILLPLAVVACWRAATGRRFAQLALAATMLAAVTLTNWVAGIALAWCFAMLLVAGAISRSETGFLGRRMLLAALLGYLLATFWLTPEYIVTTFFNWPADAFGYRTSAAKWQLSGVLVVFPLAVALVFRRWPHRYFLCFLAMCLGGFFWVVALHYWYGIDVIPESRRYALEFEFFLFAAVAEWLRISCPIRFGRDAAFLALGFILPYFYLQPPVYLWRTWYLLRPAPRFSTVEYRVADRLAAMQPVGRVFVSGGTRFRLNSWFAVPQLGGTFETGLYNRGATELTYHLQKGASRPVEERGNDALNLLRAAGVEYAAFHGPASLEHWRDIRDPELVASKLQPVWREGDDLICRVPFRGLANFVLATELPAVFPTGSAAGSVESYVRAMDSADRPPVEVEWRGNNSILLRASEVRKGYWATLRVSHHPGWRAWQDGRRIPVQADSMGNLLLEPYPVQRPTEIRLEFRPSWQQVSATLVSILTAAGCLVAIRRERRRLAKG